MTKKVLLALAVLIVLIIAYGAIQSGKLGQSVGMLQKITVEVKRSFDSTGFGAVQLVDNNGKEYYCNLIDAEKCDYGYQSEVAMKMVALPADDSIFEGWLNGCDSIETTNLDNDTCGVNVYKSKRVAEVRFSSFNR